VKRMLKIALGSAAAATMLFCSPAQSLADADLVVYPPRVVLSDGRRSAQVDMINNSKVKESYKITLVRKRMTDSGNIEDVPTPDPEEKFAEELVKFSPRQVTLPPGAAQTIRMMFKLPLHLPEGEYRSHLLFTKIPSGVSAPTESNDPPPGGVAMKIKARIGISIPVIVRHGKLAVKTEIDPSSVRVTAVEPRQQVVDFTMLRTGTRSVYGDVAVYRGADKVAVGNGLALYTPNTRRKIGLRVHDPHMLKPGEEIRVVFTERDEKKPAAETTITVP